MVTSKHPPTKFYQQDIVQKRAPPRSCGIVLRCWFEEDVPPEKHLDPLMRPLQRGEVGVSFFTGPSDQNTTLHREILPESELDLIDRSLRPGDFCKRSIDDVRSGVVTDVRVRACLEHVINGYRIDGWRTLDDIEPRRDAEIGDYVVHGDWIGQVVEMFDENIVEVSNGQLVRLPEFGSRLSVGEKGPDIIPQGNGPYSNILSYFMGNTNRANGLATVIAVKHTVYAVAWLALNQTLGVTEAQSRQRPQQFWYGQDISKLALVRSRSEAQPHISDRVNLKSRFVCPLTRHGKEEDAAGTISVSTLSVIRTETTIDVLWQDGSRETVKAVDVIPYLNPDEYDCWPGDHVLWKNEGQEREAIVQTVDAVQRTSSVLFADTGEIELVSVLELDPHGAVDDAMFSQFGHDGFGVRRGDFVFIHPEGTTNGFLSPRVPRIGELESWIRETPSMNGHLSGWRKEMSDIGTGIATSRQLGVPFEGHLERGAPLLWFGEVIDLRTDGFIEVLHPDGTILQYPLHRLTRLYDGMEQLEDDMYDAASGSYHSDEEAWSMDEDGIWHFDQTREDDEWEDYSTGSGENDYMEVDSSDWMDAPTHTSTMASTSPSRSDTPHVGPVSLISIPVSAERTPSFEVPEVAEASTASGQTAVDADPLWKRFDILPSTPHDHAFYATTPAQPAKSFLGRLSREYKILLSSLPDSIIVRGFEDRSDLLRSLIIGPENTPYEDAPFVIDWMLDSDFPNSPPIAHFLSWTNGNGRVNPNLYEEGKVCLSILGTWGGDKNETWNAARSSLLQALVSIQGLVLVKEPWFCEPAYEKLRGTEEGIVNSRLYSEKSYVLSRGFVRRALEIPLGGLEKEIQWFYITNHRLEKVLADSKRLIRLSKEAPDGPAADVDLDIAVPRLTAGGIITLERTLSRLQAILDSYSSSSS